MPYNFITVNAGTLVQELNSMKDVMSRGTVIQLAGVSVLLLTSILVKNYLTKQGVLTLLVRAALRWRLTVARYSRK